MNESCLPVNGRSAVASGTGEAGDMMAVLMELRESGQWCDVVIKLDDGGQFLAHRVVLSMSSPFFRALFMNDFAKQTQESGREVYKLREISTTVMKSVLQHCYSRNCEVDESNVEELLPVADRLLISSLKERCCAFLESQLDVSNCINLRKFAKLYFCTELASKTERFILKHFLTVATASKEWLETSAIELLEICQSDELNCKSEDELFSAIQRWLVSDSCRQDDQKLVAKVLRTVRIGLLSTPFLREAVFNNRLVRSNSAMSSLIKKELRRRNSSSPIMDPNEYSIRLRIPHEILVAVGGWTYHHSNDIIEVFDARADSWVLLDTKIDTGPRAYHGGVTISGQEIYLFGGFNGEDKFNSGRKWNLVTGEWKEIAPMNFRRCYVASALLNGRIFAIGGYDGALRLNTAEVYNPSTNQWSLIAPMNRRRSDAGAAVLDNRVYICGGFSGQECLDSAEVYDPAEDRWTMIAPMTSRRSGVTVIVYHGTLFAIGGFNGRTRIHSVERYCPKNDVWCVVASMNSARSNFAAGVIDDRLIVAGGYCGTTISKVEAYNIHTDQWTEMPPLNTSRSALTIAVITDLPNMTDYLRRTDNSESDDQASSA